MTTTNDTLTPEQIAQGIEANSVVLSLEIHKPQKSAKADMTDVDVDADKSMLRLSKDLFDAQEFGKVISFDSNLRMRIAKRYATPSKHLRGGLYRISCAMFLTVKRLLDEAQHERCDLVDAFIRVYPSIQEDAERRLRSQYDSSDYPPANVLRSKFSLDYSFHSDQVPATLRAINEGIYRQEKDKAIQRLTGEISAIETGLAVQYAQLVDGLVESLSPGPDGKPKKFRGTAITAIQDFSQTLKDRNLSGNTDLNDLADRAMAIVSNVSAEDVRASADVRRRVVSGFADLSERLSAMTEEAGRRRFAFAKKAAPEQGAAEQGAAEQGAAEQGAAEQGAADKTGIEETVE